MNFLGSVILEPGLISSAPVKHALIVGSFVAISAAVVGILVVIRGQSFAGHALGDIATIGGSASYLLSINPMVGFFLVGAVGGGAMEVTGSSRSRSKDVSTGIVLGAALGLSALLFYLDSTDVTSSGIAVTVLFGSLFSPSNYLTPLVAVLGVSTVAITLLLAHPVTFCTISRDLAQTRGVKVRMLDFVLLVAVGVTVALSSVAIGTILSTALLIGPAGAALLVSSSPKKSYIYASAISLVSVWLGVIFSYDSYYWAPHRGSWPVSFFVVAIIFLTYLVLPGFHGWLVRPRRHVAIGSMSEEAVKL